jgi:hypothetical protein
MNAFVVSGLIKRRAQLAGDIKKAHVAVIGCQRLPTGVSVRSLLPVAVAPPANAVSYNYTAIDVPGASGNTEPYGINNSGQITGTYYDGGYHGFLFSGGTYTGFAIGFTLPWLLFFRVI